MFFAVRLAALAMLGPLTFRALEENPFFGALLSAISVVLTIWIVIDTINMMHAISAWTGGK